MSNHKIRDRRSFLRGSGAALSAALASQVTAGVADAHSDDAAAISKLYRDYAAGPAAAPARQSAENSTPIRVLQDPAHAQDEIAIAPDRLTATARFHCVAQMEAPLAGDAPLLEMARLQGNKDTWWENGVHELDCVNSDAGWKIRRIAYRKT